MKPERITFIAIAALIISLSLGVLVHSATAGTPRHPPGAYMFGPTSVWTNGTTGDIFQPLSEPMPSSKIVNGRIYLEITEATSTNLRSRPALRYSADGVTWDAGAAIDTSYITGGGTQAGTVFVDFTTIATPRFFKRQC